MRWQGTSLSSTAPKTLPSLSWSPPLLTGHTHAALACMVWYGMGVSLQAVSFFWNPTIITFQKNMYEKHASR